MFGREGVSSRLTVQHVPEMVRCHHTACKQVMTRQDQTQILCASWRIFISAFIYFFIYFFYLFLIFFFNTVYIFNILIYSYIKEGK